jgi:hypothetical protein
LDESKIDQLRAWGTGLAENGGADLRATGRAILMLIEEIERLHIDLWTAQAAHTEPPLEPAGEEPLERTLRARLGRVRARK